MPRSLSCLIVLLASISSAAAQGVGTSVPEPTDGALFALGVVGLIVGRRIAKRRG
ncbi:MAG: PEP-CTERM sorting domain-containing protein [Novosphingobium meiothermophilum]|uniref:PEP-CTERM sorting domain-containing protein n=1 Tax=Novosphingobium TaxID=165696 RepID=UPI001374E79D|nr:MULTISPECIES: PEP-CTERM sorting domain-containing protein [Novosphingobium]